MPPVLRITSVKNASISLGTRNPTVSGRLIVVAPASIAVSTTWQRKSISLRVASSAENSMSSVVVPRLGNARADRPQALLPAHPQLALQVQIRGGQKRVEAGPGGWPQGLAGALDVARVAAREAGDHRAPDLLGDQLHGARVVIGGDREARFDDIRAQRIDLAGKQELLVRVHRETRRLFAVAKGGVEYDQSIRGHWMLRRWVPRRAVGGSEPLDVRKSGRDPTHVLELAEQKGPWRPIAP